MGPAPLAPRLLVVPLLALAACDRGASRDVVTKRPPAEVAAKAIADAKALLGSETAPDPAHAAALLAATFGDSPADPEAALLLARACFRAEDPDHCSVALDALFARAPKEHGDWLAEGDCFRAWLAERSGDFKGAVAGYRRALDRAPNYTYAIYRMGVAQGEAGDVEGGIASLERAVTRMPGLIEGHFNLARLLRRAGKEAEAAREAEIHRQLNLTTENSSRTAESLFEKYGAYERLEQIYPAFVEGRLQLTRFQVARHMNDVAIQRMERLVAEQGESNEAWTLLIEVLRKAKGDDAARRELGRLAPTIPKLPEARRAQIEKIVREGFGS
jgi:tetratricopeptide (TPR) repeat protein